MPFDSSDNFRLVLRQYSGGPSREFRNLAAGLTELKQGTATVDAATIIAAVTASGGHTPTNDYTIKVDTSVSPPTLRWAEDITGTGGMGGEQNVQTDYNVTDPNSDAFLLNKPIIFPDANGNLPAAVAADVNHIGMDHGNLRIGHKNVLHPATSLNVTYAPYIASDYIGSFRYPNTAGIRANATYLFSTQYRRFYQYIAGSNVWAATNPPGNARLIVAANEAAADQAVQGVGDFVYLINDFSRVVRRVTAYTPETSEQVAYDWQPPQEIQALEARPVLPTPAFNNLGQAAIVNDDGDGYTLVALFDGDYNSLSSTPTIPEAISRSNVYDFVKDIIVAGDNITATDNDTDETVSIAGQAGGGVTPTIDTWDGGADDIWDN